MKQVSQAPSAPGEGSVLPLKVARRNQQLRSPGFLAALRFLVAVLLLLGIVTLPCRGFAAGPRDFSRFPVVPVRQIQQQATPAVKWQALWVQARNAVRQEDFEAAVPLYQQLLALKPDLEEAGWELAKIWLRQEKPEKAAALLERLLEMDPDQIYYLHALAFLLQGKAYYSRSVDLYARILKNEPEHAQALAGVVQGLVKLRRKEEALSYLKRLHRLQPNDRQVRRELATLAYEIGDFNLARAHLVELAEESRDDLPLLEMTARVHERLGLENLATPYRMRIVTSQPDHQESHDHLAWHYQQHGRTEEALYHFQALLKNNPTNPSILHAIGRLLENSGRFAEALPYFERYLAHRPKDRKVLDTIVNLHAALGERAEMLTSLERLLAVEPDPDPGKIKLAAQLYDEAGQFEKAIPLFRRVLAVTPDDREVIAALALALNATGKEDGALAMWRHLSELDPTRLESYHAMAEILLRQQRHEELIPVLERIHALDNDDERVVLRLAAAYLERDELARAMHHLGKMKDNTPLRPEYLEIRGGLHERLLQPGQALQSYEALLEIEPGRSEIRLKCISLAGELGKLSTLRRHLEPIASPPQDIRVELLIARSLTGCGVYDEAISRLRALLGPDSISGAHRQEILLTMAEVYRQAGLPYEAEQSLRLALLGEGDITAMQAGLFELALEAGDLELADFWINQLREAGAHSGWGLLAARLHSARGEHRTAIELSRQTFPEAADDGGERPPRRYNDVSLLEPKLLLAAGQLTEARRYCLAAAGQGSPLLELERLVLLQQIASRQGDVAEWTQAHADATELGSGDPGLLLRLGSLYQEAGLREPALQTAQQAVAAAPDSVRAWFLLIDIQLAAGETETALAAIRHLATLHPGHVRVLAMESSLLFKTGRFAEAEAVSASVHADDPYYPQQQQLKGRALWRQNRWQEALAVYEQFLSPPVVEELEQKSAARGVFYLPEISRITIWQLLSYREAESAALIDRVMAPASAADSSSQRQRDLNAVAAPLYAAYRWQQRFADELAARRSVVRREYFLAIRLFENLLKSFPDDESLMFDLAGLYGNQGLPGEEAVLYRRIAATHPDFPGLKEAVERNELKRQPRFHLAYDRSSEEGRDGKKAIRRDQAGFGGWFSPALQREIDFAATLIRYQSTEEDRDLQARRAVISYQTDFNSNISVRVGGGVEDLENDLPSTGLIDTLVTGRIGDKWRSYVSFARDVTTDTITSLTRNIVRHDFNTGLGIDILPRLRVGADYSYTDFSDHNTTKGYELWASYILHTEPTFLKVSYSYDFKDSRRGNRPGLPLEDGFAVDDPPYWTPVNYWVNQTSIHFKHLLARETFDRDIPRYYILEYSLGHDSNGEAIQSLKGSFFLEWTRRLLMEAAAELISSEPYRRTGLSLSAIYRW